MALSTSQIPMWLVCFCLLSKYVCTAFCWVSKAAFSSSRLLEGSGPCGTFASASTTTYYTTSLELIDLFSSSCDLKRVKNNLGRAVASPNACNHFGQIADPCVQHPWTGCPDM
jgi:hypothetical protein